MSIDFSAHSLKEYTTIEQAIAVVKTMVPPDLVKYITEEMVKSIWQHAKKREYKLSSLVNSFTNMAESAKRMELLSTWSGVIVGGKDIRKYNDPVESVKGQTVLMVTDKGATRFFTVWGHDIGTGQSSEEPPVLKRSKIRVEEGTWSKGDRSGEKNTAKLVMESTDIPESELKQFLLDRCMPLSMLSEDYKYKSVLVKGKISFISPVANFVATDELVPAKDKHNNIIYFKDDKGGFVTDERGEKIMKMKAKMMPDGVGQPMIQLMADGSNREQYVMKIALYDDDDPVNRVSAKMQRTKFGVHTILLPDSDIIIKDAAAAPLGGKEDGWATLTNMYRSLDVVVAGTVISAKSSKDGNSMWFTIDASLIIDVTGMGEGTPVPAYTPAPVSTPVPTPTPPLVARTVPPTPVDVPVPAPVETPIVSPVTDATLKNALDNIFDIMGIDVSYEQVKHSSLFAFIPKQYQSETQTQVVIAVMDKIRLDRKEASSLPPVVTAPIPTVPSPSDDIKTKLVAQMTSVAPPEVMERVSAGASEEVHQCQKCGVKLKLSEVLDHRC